MSSKYMYEAEQEVNKLIDKGLYPAEEKWPNVVKLAAEMLAKDVKGIIEGCSNTYSRDYVTEAFKQAFRTTHRQSQSDFWDILLKVIKNHGEADEGANFDGRNAWVKQLCQRLTLAAENPHLVEGVKG